MNSVLYVLASRYAEQLDRVAELEAEVVRLRQREGAYQKMLRDVIAFVRTGGPLYTKDREELIAFVSADLAALSEDEHVV